jgi:hypothetical protein
MKLTSYSQEQMDKIDQMIAKLNEELQNGYSDNFKNYLLFSSKFHKYSFGNQILISIQNPLASKVASYDDWQTKFNRQVKKGAKGIKILVPVFKKVEVNNNGVVEEEKRLVSYRVGNVFDVADTEGQEIKEFFYALGDKGQSHYETLTRIMEKEGIKVVEESIKPQGISYGGLVKINSSLDGTNKFLTLIHEYAHELLHKGSENAALSRGLKECQAEAVAYIVANYFEVESPVSSDYLQNWGNTADTLKENLKPVIRASQLIINQLVQELSVSESNLTEEMEAA